MATLLHCGTSVAFVRNNFVVDFGKLVQTFFEVSTFEVSLPAPHKKKEYLNNNKNEAIFFSSLSCAAIMFDSTIMTDKTKLKNKYNKGEFRNKSVL